MRLFKALILGFLFISCQESTIKQHHFSTVSVNELYKDSISVRAIEIIGDSLLGFGHNKGYGFIDLKTGTPNMIFFKKDSVPKPNWITEQRAVAKTKTSFFSLSIGSPARLRKIDLHTLEERIVYKEEHPKVFYDAMSFWNDREGIAMGDPTDDCLSIIITRDGGETWNKIPCEQLPKTDEGEAAFAASNGNISIVGDDTWIVSGGKKSRLFYSSDKGMTWSVQSIPIIQGASTTGAYSCQFYDKNIGVIYGGDYTKPDNNSNNKLTTIDGGKTWKVLNRESSPGYRSCVRYIPNSGGKEMVAIGFKGISISNDSGENWVELSKDSFYTIRFINDSTAIAAGKNRIAQLNFK